MKIRARRSERVTIWSASGKSAPAADDSSASRLSRRLAGHAHDDLVDEELVDVVEHLLGRGHLLQPRGGRGVVVGEIADIRRRDPRVIDEPVEPALRAEPEPRGRRGKPLADLTGERPGRVEHAQRLGVGRERRIVEEQHDPEVGEFLQRRRPQGRAYDVRLLGIRRYEHGDPVLVGAEVPVELTARHAHVALVPVHRAEAREKVHRRGEGQEGDHDGVADRLHREGEVGARGVDEQPHDGRQEVVRPEAHRRHDGDSGPRDRPGARPWVHDREGFATPLRAPLAAASPDRSVPDVGHLRGCRREPRGRWRRGGIPLRCRFRCSHVGFPI
ncbi:hypothetical protein [Cryobacterium breve]|uniref:hypothetical protein n=1 Tax=Cryobacterium breve TaxID=1259258 RepID=UPI0032B15353